MIIVFWIILTGLFNYFIKDFKVTRMLISTFHALSIILSYNMNYQGSMLTDWSITYYLMDMFYELQDQFRLFKLGIILHHILAIINVSYLNDKVVEHYIFYIFYIAEISNMPMYLWYYLSHTGYSNHPILNYIILSEIIFYIILRLGIGTYMSYQYFFIPEMPILINISSVIMLIISMIWTIKLIKQLRFQSRPYNN